MKHSESMIGAAVVVFGLLACDAALASSSNDLPALQTQGAVSYLSGGIGEREAKAIEHVESTYPLSLEFVQHAKPRDEFLADVGVKIADRTGKTTLNTVTDGPFLLARIPDGSYTVKASEGGKTLTRHITIAAGKPAHVEMVW